MGRQDDLFHNLGGNTVPAYRDAPDQDLDLLRATATNPGPVGLPVCALMTAPGRTPS